MSDRHLITTDGVIVMFSTGGSRTTCSGCYFYDTFPTRSKSTCQLENLVVDADKQDADYCIAKCGKWVEVRDG